MDAERWKRVDDLLHSALQMPAEQQQEFLRRSCGQDATLLEEVRSLLTAHWEAGSFLEEPVVNRDATAGTQATAPFGTGLPTVTTMAGQTVSHYHVASQLGSGGMGVVYEAEDMNLRRRVAMKFLPGEVASDRGAFERVKREARAASALDHPNICSIFELGEHQGRPFIVMQLLRGQTLRQWIETTPKQNSRERLSRTIDFAIEIAEGLEAAHQKGIVHRDIKPANVFITTGDRVKILDFGLAKVLEEHAPPEVVRETQSTNATAAILVSDRSQLTRTGTTMGTAHYMSPEQVRGENLDSSTDLFSFGLVLYEMATGRRAFEGETGAAVYEAILERAPAPVRQLNPEVPSELERIINKATEKDRARRYQSAGEIARDLESLRQDLGGTFLWQNRRGMAVVAATLIVLAVGLVIWLGPFRHPTHGADGSYVKARRAITVLGFANLGGRPGMDWLSTGLSQMLGTELAAGGMLRLIPGEDVARAKTELHISDAGELSKYNLGRLRKNLGADVVIFGSYTALGDDEIRLDVRMQDAASGEAVTAFSEPGSEKRLFDLVSLTGAEVRQRLGAGSAPASAEPNIKASLPVNPEAARFYSQGLEKLRGFDSLEARDLLLKAVELEPNHAATHSALAEAWRNLGYDIKAQEEAQKAVDLSADLNKEDQLWFLGRLHEMHHQWDKAAIAYNTLLHSYPDGLEYGLRLASVQMEGGKARDALATAELLRKLPSPFRDDPRIDLVAANACSRLGEYKQQQLLAARAEQVARAQEATLVAARALVTKCGSLRSLGQFQPAIAAGEDAYRIFNDAGDRAQAASALNNIALTLQDQGDLAGAKSKFKEALTIANRTGDKRSEARYTNNLASNLWTLGDLAGAKENYERSLKIAREVDDKIGATNTLGNIGLILVGMEDFPGARAKYEEAMALARQIGNKQAEASSEIHLAELLLYRGELTDTTRALKSADSLLQGTGDKRHQIYALFTWGDLLSAQDDLPGAWKKLQEAMDISKQIGAKDLVAYSEMAQAVVATADGRATDGVALAKAAADEYEAEKSSDFEVQALDVLSYALVENEKLTEANNAIQRAKGLISAHKSPQAQIDLTTAAARTDAALGKTGEAIPSLRRAIAEAHRHGATGSEFEARLVLGEVELEAHSLASGRSHLEQLEKEARSRGYLLIAREAKLALNNQAHHS